MSWGSAEWMTSLCYAFSCRVALRGARVPGLAAYVPRSCVELGSETTSAIIPKLLFVWRMRTFELIVTRKLAHASRTLLRSALTTISLLLVMFDAL